MVFSSVVFLSVFFPLFIVLYFLSRSIRYKNCVLVVFSLFFYAWGEPVWVALLLFSGCMDYVNGRVIGRYFGKWQAKSALFASVAVNLGILALFKYSNFFIENINAAFQLTISFPRFNLPLGISFYTFQTLTYTIDAYRGKLKPQKSLLSYLTYLTMFPQLVAGPIVRYSDIEDRIDSRVTTAESFSAGITRFSTGLAKKVILANSAGSVAALLLDGDISKLSGASAWIGIFMFTFQIYFDFSGYSDMAIGMGKMAGFDYRENFDYPYTSRSVTEFWRRWHMSLGTFFRDYVYIPLGGNRRFQMRNLLIVWFLTGLWHGASWNFIFWGLYYFILLAIEKLFFLKILERLPSFLRRVYALGAVVGGWILFYFTDLTRLKAFVKACLFMNGTWDFLAESTITGHIWLIIILIPASTPLIKNIAAKYPGLRMFSPVLNAVLLVTCFALILGQTYNPFLYFRF